MSDEKNGGSIFPIPEVRDQFGNGVVAAHEGMTLRDYFAAQALAYLANRDLFQPKFAQTPEAASIIAINVYAIADAMLAKRSK